MARALSLDDAGREDRQAQKRGESAPAFDVRAHAALRAAGTDIDLRVRAPGEQKNSKKGLHGGDLTPGRTRA